MILDDGTWSLTVSVEGEDFVEASGEQFTVSGDRMTFDWERVGSVLTFDSSVDEDGSIHLVPVGPMDRGDQLAWTSQPWTKIEGSPSDDAAVALNGVYRWTVTEEDAVASGTEPTTPEHLATFPWVMTLTLDEGTWALTVRSEGEDSLEATDEEFEVSGDRIKFHWEGAQLEFTFSVDSEGNLELTPVEPMPAGDQFVWSTYPLTKIE
jgi:hypothetical protein